MSAISRIPWKNSGVEIINDIDVNNIHFWLNEKHIKIGLGIQICKLLQTNMTQSIENLNLN